jgi:hypothetical protein
MIARNDGVFTVAGFRIRVERLANAHKSCPELVALKTRFRTQVHELLSQYPPDRAKRQCPTVLVSAR